MGNRIIFSCQAIGFSRDGSTSYTVCHGVQSVGLSTTFNLEQVFELGQLSIYENIENIPDIECTVERVLDGYPLAYHLVTRDYAANSLAGRSNCKTGIAMSFYGDTQNSASGTPVAEVNMSGMYVNSMTYTLPVEGNCTESISLIGSNKTWKTSSFTFNGTLFDNTDQPLALSSGLGGVQRRENVVFGASTLLPYGTNGIYGISSSGTNNKTNGQYAVHLQGITINTSLNRTNVLELGRREPYYRYVNFPVEVSTEISTLSTYGDDTQATEAGVAGSGNNLTDQRIKIVLEDGTVFDLGSRNKLSSSSYSGGDTGGGNATMTYTYVNYNDLVITHPQMP